METLIERWLATPSKNLFNLSMKKSVLGACEASAPSGTNSSSSSSSSSTATGPTASPSSRQLFLCLPSGAQKYMLLYDAESATARERVRDLVDLEHNESLKDLIGDLAGEEVMEIVNSLLESTVDEAAMDIAPPPPPAILMHKIFEQRAKNSRVPFNRRILNDMAGIMKAIEVDGETSFSLDCSQNGLSTKLKFSDGIHSVYDESSFSLDEHDGLLAVLHFNQPGAEKHAKLLAKDLERVGLSGIQISLAFPEGYPFSPPKVRLVKPRLRSNTGYVINGGLCMQLLDAAGWSPAITLVGVLLSIYAMLLSGYARLEIPDEGQSVEDYLQAKRSDKRKRDAHWAEKQKRLFDEALMHFRARKALDVKAAGGEGFSKSTHCPRCFMSTAASTSWSFAAAPSSSSSSSIEALKAKTAAALAVAQDNNVLVPAVPLVPAAHEPAAPPAPAAAPEPKCPKCHVLYCCEGCRKTDQALHELVCSYDSQLLAHVLATAGSVEASLAAAAAAADVAVPKARAGGGPAGEVVAIESFAKKQQERMAREAEAMLAAPVKDKDKGKDSSAQLEDMIKKCVGGYTASEAANAADHIVRVHQKDGWQGRKMDS